MPGDPLTSDEKARPRTVWCPLCQLYVGHVLQTERATLTCRSCWITIEVRTIPEARRL